MPRQGDGDKAEACSCQRKPWLCNGGPSRAHYPRTSQADYRRKLGIVILQVMPVYGSQPFWQHIPPQQLPEGHGTKPQ